MCLCMQVHKTTTTTATEPELKGETETFFKHSKGGSWCNISKNENTTIY